MCLLLSGWVLAAPPEQPEQDLQQLRQKIDSLKQELQANEANRSEAADALKDSEQAISEANRVYAELNRQQIASQAELTRVNLDISAVRASLDNNRQRLARLLRARYRNGEHEALRLLLNRQDPNQLSRDLHYYRYIAEAQHKLSGQLQKQLDTLNQLAAQIEAKHQELVKIAAEKKAQRDKLRSEQAKKQQVLTEIASQIGAQRKEIGKLQRDELRLTQLVEKLNRLIKEREAQEAREREKQAKAEKLAEAREAARQAKQAKAAKRAGKVEGIDKPAEEIKPEKTVKKNDALPDPSIDGQKFAELKGQLRLPARGEVMGKFGSPRSEGTLWKGVFIKTGNGQPIKAVASGRVVFADWLRGFGNMLIIDHGGGYLSLYGAAEALMKQVGDTVKPGEDIASSGNSGGNAETGIYFELRHLGKPVDPLLWAK
ncbi:murein hydrolase activator EnvC [Chitinimonas sp.]|uniref:murein hydrolase activator EnvC family protein n=1 Tax=Chitinimonas sp. TaxID=1934313 RepID=UPI0035B40830